MFPRAHVAVTAIALCAMLPCPAQAEQRPALHPALHATMHARFTPKRLGSATTVSLGFQITAGADAPTALSSIDLAYPPNLGLATSGLGLAACSPQALAVVGSAVCPADSRMGGGSALVEIPIGPAIIKETVQLALFAGPSPDGRLHILVYASGLFPVIAQVVLSAVLMSGHLNVTVPPIPSLPDGPYVALAQMRLTLGGHLTYNERVGGRTITYHPAGVALPRSCPRGGFPFAATFAFIDGARARAHTAVACPRRR